MDYETEHYLNFEIYIGNSQNGKAHGKRIYTWKNGDMYDWDWKDDKTSWRILMRKLILNFIFLII